MRDPEDDEPDFAAEEDDDFGRAAPSPGMSTTVKVVLCVLAGLLVILVILATLVMERCSAFVSDVLEKSDVLLTDGSYSPYRRLEMQPVEVFLRRVAEDPESLPERRGQRYVVLTGRVSEVQRTPPDFLQVVFRTREGVVQCRFLTSLAADLEEVREGDTLIVGGVFDWASNDTVQLLRCRLQEHWERQGRRDGAR